MRTSTQIETASVLVGEEKAVEYVAKAGFDAWDFSMFAMCDYDWRLGAVRPTTHPLAGENYLAFARKLKQIGLDNGITCNQSHAPFPTSCPEIRSYFKRAIECTAEAGGKICIIHPDNDKSAAENAEMYLELLPFAKDCGVKIATENMWNWDDAKDESCFAACATSESFIEHIDAALKEIGYKGWFTLEADHYLKEKFNAENVFEGMKDLHTAAVRFEKLFDEA